jgi:hypothetical protein
MAKPKRLKPKKSKPAAKAPRVDIVDLKEAARRANQSYWVIYRAIRAGTLHGIQLVPGGRLTVNMYEIYDKYPQAD